MSPSLQGEGRDFWRSCGHHLLDRDADGALLVTGDFLKAYLARPELVPPPGACPAERRLHDALLADPRQPVAALWIAAMTGAGSLRLKPQNLVTGLPLRHMEMVN